MKRVRDASGRYLPVDVRQRFDAKWTPEPNTGCWLWTACVVHSGYGNFDREEAHRVAWRLYRGPIPEGMYIDHMCRVRSCVNPDHLRVVTPKQNSLENSESFAAKYAKQTECVRGHPFSGDNLRVDAGGRRCKQCDRDDHRRNYRRTKRFLAARCPEVVP